MVNIASNLKFKIKFCDLNYKTGTIDIDDLKKNISKKTLAVVLTNMFNDFESSNNVKKLVKKKNIFLIEDNAYILIIIQKLMVRLCTRDH